MKNLRFIIISFFILCAAYLPADAGNNIPRIGAQVFIEPEQTGEDIDGFFHILAMQDMDIARIRLFGSHIQRPGGQWDFTLYDKAFDAAARYGIKLFVTLFPPTDPLSDVGGFKFPSSKAQLAEIGEYIKAVVNHYKDHPALDTWVLQNEPGGAQASLKKSDWLDDMRKKWNTICPEKAAGNDEYLKMDFSKDKFYYFCMTEYLQWISEQVQKYDKNHGRHINPHKLLDNLVEYDFGKYEDFLTSLGVSMHMSWHFGYFNRAQYPLGVSLMSDIIRDAAGKNPFWITELQGGNVTASGVVPICPTAEEIRQWLWTGIASGAEGVIFWTLNQRKAAKEAGEWGLIDFQKNPSDRLLAAAEVSATIKENASFFKGAKPVSSDISILYNRESLLLQKQNAEFSNDNINEGRKSSAVIKSVCCAYEALSTWGITPSVCEMSRFDWSDAEGKCVVLPDMISLPAYYQDKIISFVADGGRLIITGMTGFYDENMRCILMGDFPFKECFGAEIKEYKVAGQYFSLNIEGSDITVPAHLWACSMLPGTAAPICLDGENVSGTINRYGKGEVIWLPVLMELGGWQRDMAGVIDFYGKCCANEIRKQPVHFKEPAEGVLMKLMENDRQMLAVIINKNPGNSVVELAGNIPSGKLVKLGGEATVSGNVITLKPEDCCVLTWKK